ncbi:MAG: lysophospholipid acyltransferase family protein [Gemmatimonadales bacterium]|nr:lysophospholipid acyltransferase family protein [Gemmatimonadales bacterium]
MDNPALDNLLVYTYCQGMNLKNRSEYLSFRSMLALLGKLPPSQASSVLAGLGRFSGGILRIRRRVVEDQLGIVFPDLSAAGRGALANRIYDHLGRTVGEVFGSGMDVLVKNARIEPGWDRVDQALAFGRGAIVATGHIGNFELGGALIASRYPLLDVVKNQRNTEFNTYLERLRNERGIQTVSMQQPGRAVLNHLRSGGLVSLLVDQDAGAAGIGTDFLGRPASTWPGAARFSIRTGCPVIPMAILREGPGRHVLRISEPLEPSGLTDRPEDIISYTARISVAVEEFIWQNPEQWFWVHRRWKGAKAGVES